MLIVAVYLCQFSASNTVDALAHSSGFRCPGLPRARKAQITLPSGAASSAGQSRTSSSLRLFHQSVGTLWMRARLTPRASHSAGVVAGGFPSPSCSTRVQQRCYSDSVVFNHGRETAADSQHVNGRIAEWKRIKSRDSQRITGWKRIQSRGGQRTVVWVMREYQCARQTQGSIIQSFPSRMRGGAKPCSASACCAAPILLMKKSS